MDVRAHDVEASKVTQRWHRYPSVSKFSKVFVWRGRRRWEGVKALTGGSALGDGAMCPSPMWE